MPRKDKEAYKDYMKTYMAKKRKKPKKRKKTDAERHALAMKRESEARERRLSKEESDYEPDSCELFRAMVLGQIERRYAFMINHSKICESCCDFQQEHRKARGFEMFPNSKT